MDSRERKSLQQDKNRAEVRRRDRMLDDCEQEDIDASFAWGVGQRKGKGQRLFSNF